MTTHARPHARGEACCVHSHTTSRCIPLICRLSRMTVVGYPHQCMSTAARDGAPGLLPAAATPPRPPFLESTQPNHVHLRGPLAGWTPQRPVFAPLWSPPSQRRDHLGVARRWPGCDRAGVGQTTPHVTMDAHGGGKCPPQTGRHAGWQMTGVSRDLSKSMYTPRWPGTQPGREVVPRLSPLRWQPGDQFRVVFAVSPQWGAT
jgi:hypothetical protein